MSRSFSRAELVELADGLRRLLDAIAAGELTAPSGTVSRLEGAWLAVQTLSKGRIIDISSLLDTEPPIDV
jgi:hypothetical protein